MKATSHGRFHRVLGIALAAVLLVSMLPLAGSFTARAAKTKGAYFISGTPAFAYVITGVSPEDAANTVELHQDRNMLSYDGYTGSYVIPATVTDTEDHKEYTVTRIGGASTEVALGAFQNTPVTGVVLPETLTSIGSKAFAGAAGLLELSFPTSVVTVEADSFRNVALRKLTLDVVTETTLYGTISYATARAPAVRLPQPATDLRTSAPLTVAGWVYIPGGAELAETVTVQSAGVLQFGGALTGSGDIEVKDGGSVTLKTASPAYTGVIRLAGGAAELTNDTNLPVTALNLSGRAIVANPGETVNGATVGGPEPTVEPTAAPTSQPPVDDGTPVITHNEGGSVSVEQGGKVVVITAQEGYRVAKVTVNGLDMGSITRYEFETATSANTVDVRFERGEDPSGPVIVVPTSFVDVAANASYAAAVQFLAENHIIYGVGNDQFAPELKTSRAMMVTLMRRMENYARSFRILPQRAAVLPEDVAPNSWYTEAVLWATAAGIVELDGQVVRQPLSEPAETPVLSGEEGEEAPAEEQTAEEAPVEEEPTEEAPVEEEPVEETPAEEPTEEQPAEEAPVEETPAEEQSAEETPADEEPAEDTAPADEEPAEETPAEEEPAEDEPVEENPEEEEPAPGDRVTRVASFQPDRLITRQEVALYLYRYTRLRGRAALVDASAYHIYQDSLLLNAEARNAMVWAISKGYLPAHANNMLDPADTVTRAEVAQLLAKYLRAN